MSIAILDQMKERHEVEELREHLSFMEDTPAFLDAELSRCIYRLQDCILAPNPAPGTEILQRIELWARLAADIAALRLQQEAK